MKRARIWVNLGICGLIAAAGSVAPLHAQSNANLFVGGASYVTTVLASNGSFASRGVITLHLGGTMSVIDSGQGGPTFLFSSQLGSWAPDGNGGLVARTIDFDFPSVDVARLDYTIKFSTTPGQITGTITLTTFPLTANPLNGGGTLVGTFTFTGQLITP